MWRAPLYDDAETAKEWDKIPCKRTDLLSAIPWDVFIYRMLRIVEIGNCRGDVFICKLSDLITLNCC